MAITEQDRIRLYRYFEGEMGEDLATKMMDSLPPAGWGDIATKQDLVGLKDDLEGRLSEGFEKVDRRFEAMEQRLDRRFDAIDHRFDIIEHRFALADERLEAVEHKLGKQFYRALVTQTMVFVAVVGGIAALTDVFRG